MDLMRTYFLSIVVPAFNEEDNLHKLAEEIAETMAPLDCDWELIFSDDGSKDGTWKDIEALYQRDNHVKGLRLSRNFGQQYALMAGLCQAKGDAVIMMDADLQHPPQVITQLVEEWKKGFKIVHTVRLEAKTLSWFKKITSKYYFTTVHIFILNSDMEFNRNGYTFV